MEVIKGVIMEVIKEVITEIIIEFIKEVIMEVIKEVVMEVIMEVIKWMTCNKLKLNDDKTEAVTVGTRLRSSAFCGEHLKVGDYEIPFKHL